MPDAASWYILSPPGPAPVPPAPPFVFELVGYLASAVPAIARCYPGHLPRSGVAYPALVYNLVFADRFSRLGGASGTASENFQLDVYSPDDGQAVLANATLREALNGFHGTMGRTFVREAWLADRNSSFEPFTPGGDAGTYRHMNEYSFIYDEPVS